MAHSPETSQFSFGRAAMLGVAVVAAGLAFGSPRDAAAHDLDIGFCAPSKEAMTELVSAEGHRTLATMKARVIDTEKEVVRFTDERITATDNGSEWYLINDDGNEECPSQVSGRGTKGEINDYRFVEPLRVAQYDYDATEAKMGCRALGSKPGEGACDDHHSLLRQRWEEHGEWLAFQGIMEGRDGGESIMNLVVNDENQEYADLSRHPIGTTEVVSWGKDFAFNDDVYRRLDQLRMMAQGSNAPQLAQK